MENVIIDGSFHRVLLLLNDLLMFNPCLLVRMLQDESWAILRKISKLVVLCSDILGWSGTLN